MSLHHAGDPTVNLLRLKLMGGEGWSLTMRQLYDKSGSAARFSDFALDVRKIVSADDLPEYALRLHRNSEGEDVVAMIRRSLLPPSDPRFEMQRIKQRRKGRGLQQKALTFTG